MVCIKDVTRIKEKQYRYFFLRFYRQNPTALMKIIKRHRGVSMKIMSLLTAPLAYLPFSSATPSKADTVAKPNPTRAKKSRSSRADKPADLKPFRGTSIVFDDCACDAVKAIGKSRFLLSEGNTPMLPLPACDASRCNCKYMHHDDRRDYDDDRRLSAALRTDLYEDTGNTDRRSKKRGRRASDK